MDIDHAPWWLSLHEAADRLNVSVKTARRRVKAGQLPGRQVPPRHGPDRQVRGDAGGPTTTVGGQGTRPDQGSGFVELVRLVDRLQSDLLARTEAAAMWQARAETLAHHLGRAQRALEAPQAPETAVASKLTALEQDPLREPSKPTPAPTPASKPPPVPVPIPLPPETNGGGWWARWWARWWDGLAVAT